jgi:hypothetical protein
MLSRMRTCFFLALSAAVVALGSGCRDVPGAGVDDPPPDDPRPLPDDDDDDIVDDDVDPPVDLEPLPERPDAPFAPSAARLRRLLGYQYQNAVADLLGAEAAAVVQAPPDVPLNGSVAIGSGELAVAPAAVDAYESAAHAAGAAAVADADSPVRDLCTPARPDDRACWRELATRLGRRAFRRTLESAEVDRYALLGEQVAGAYVDFDLRPVDKGREFLIAALLQSPHFLYLVERGEPGDEPDARRLTGAELASRLSFFLVGAPPDDELLDAAEGGALDSPTALEAAARALLADPRAPAALRAYFFEKLELAGLATANRPDPELTPAVRAALVEETLMLIDDVVWRRNVDVRELLRTTDTFVNDELAAWYGFPLPGSGDFFVKVPTPPEEGRAGLLTRGAFLMRFAHPDRSSPTLRGKFLREHILCTAVPAPPPEVVTVLPEESDGLPRTTRDRLQAHAHERSCAGCHSFMDPPGYVLEHFDQFGRYRTHENGLPIDSSGELDGRLVDDAAGFMDVLDERVDMVSCLARGVYRHAVGRLEEEGQEAALYDVDAAFIAGGLRLQEALVAIASSDAFRFVNTTDEE